MSDTWAAVLAISIAIQTLVQVGVLIGLLLSVRKIAATAQATQLRVEGLVSDVQAKVALAVGDVRDVTAQVSNVVGAGQQWRAARRRLDSRRRVNASPMPAIGSSRRFVRRARRSPPR